MKCPSCGGNQQVKDGLVCGRCRYGFALNPKEPPGLSDGAMAGVARRLSGPDGLHFTRDQFRLGVWRLLTRKRKLGCVPAAVAILFAGAFLGGVSRMIGLPHWIGYIAGAAAVIAVGRKINRHIIRIPAAELDRAVETYLAAHPPETLVDGARLSGLTQSAMDAELVQYAPERILVVQHDDLVDMLVLNRFHFDHKILVVGANKYPRAAFDAAVKFMLAHPELPVCAAHDASEDGLRMIARLRKDLEWGLEHREITDLGIHPKDVETLKQAVWLPESTADSAGKQTIPVGGDPFARVKEGYRLPLAVAPPRALITSLSAAVIAGTALLSPELEAHLRETRGADVGGFG